MRSRKNGSSKQTVRKAGSHVGMDGDGDYEVLVPIVSGRAVDCIATNIKIAVTAIMYGGIECGGRKHCGRLILYN
jgi:hypothetical protein